MRPRIAITGLGAVTALGNGAAALDRGLREARSGIAEITLFDLAGMRARIGGQAPDPDEALDPGLATAAVSRPDRFGLLAAAEAIAQAGVAPTDLAAAACVFGTGTGGLALTERHVSETRAGGHPPSSLLVAHQACSVTDSVARRFALGGPRTTIMTACSSSATAIGYASDLIRLGRAQVAIAGGAEGLCRLTWAGFGALRATSAEPCRPFDRDRKGLNLGEGAGVMVLESEEHARRRGAAILGLVAGYGVTADAHHMTAPHPEGDGAARAMIAALDDAGLPAAAVDYVNAHGTATPQNDAAEVLALRRVFGDRGTPLPVSSTKSQVGHTLGAAGAIEAITCVLAMNGGYLPATLNHQHPDSPSSLDFIAEQPGAGRIDVALSSSFAFGGNNTVLVFARA